LKKHKVLLWQLVMDKTATSMAN